MSRKRKGKGIGKGKDFMKDLAVSSDIFNTMTGGIINPHFRIERLDDSLRMTIHLPSVDQRNVHVEIKDNKLIVMYYMEFKANLLPVRIPVTTYNRTLPYFIDVTRVSATFDENILVVNMPFNTLANGYSRQLDIAS